MIWIFFLCIILIDSAVYMADICRQALLLLPHFRYIFIFNPNKRQWVEYLSVDYGFKRITVKPLRTYAFIFHTGKIDWSDKTCATVLGLILLWLLWEDSERSLCGCFCRNFLSCHQKIIFGILFFVNKFKQFDFERLWECRFQSTPGEKVWQRQLSGIFLVFIQFKTSIKLTVSFKVRFVNLPLEIFQTLRSQKFKIQVHRTELQRLLKIFNK